MPLSTAPTFNGGPPYFDIDVGSSGDVLTSQGAGNAPKFAPGGAGGNPTFGTFVSVALSAGINDNVNPGGTWPSGYGRVDFDTSAGNATVTGLVAGSDGQAIIIRNSGANVLTLASLNAGSTAANQFLYAADLQLPENGSVLVVYYSNLNGGSGAWVIV